MRATASTVVCILLGCCFMEAFGQKAATVTSKAVIRGSVFDKKDGAPMIYTTVYLKGTTYGALTDNNGFFTIAKVPKGTYTLVATGLGYDTASMEVEIVRENQIVSKNLYINKVGVTMQTVDVLARRQEKTTQSLVSTIKVTAADVKALPSVGGEADIAQYIQIIPGVVFTGDQGGQLYIRGGSPEQNLVLLDGLTIFNAFHSIGLFSVFDNDIIKSTDIYTGGFNAEYGGRISAVMDVRTRDGDKNFISGKVSISPFIAKAELEGPLLKAKKEGGGSITYVLDDRNSILDKTAPVFYKYANNGSLPYSFNDFYGKLAYNSSNGSKFSAFGFSNIDNTNIPDVATFAWKQYGVGANFIVVPGSTSTIIDGMVGYSHYGINMAEADDQPRNNAIGAFNAAMNFTYFIKAGELHYGVVLNASSTDFNFTNSTGTLTQQQGSSTEMDAYVKFRKVLWNRLVLEPGIRFNYYASISEISPEPRLDAKLSITDWFRLKLAGGLYSQNLISTKADQDVVDFFPGFLLAPDETLTKPNGQPDNTKLQKAAHAIFGVEMDLAKHIEINIEPWYKRYLQLIDLNRYKEFPTQPDFITENGNAYGVDFLIKYNYKNISLWGAYSYSHTEVYDGVETYAPFWDRTHNINLVASYRFGKNLDWNVGARWNLGSGFPFTRTQAFYEDLSFASGISTNYINQNGSLGTQYESQIDAGRMPWYHRLDISASKHFTFNKYVGMDITLSVTNVYNRDNIFYFNRVTEVIVYQLPVLPSLAVALSF